MECRICKDSETVRAKLIAPCKCRGSIGLVHRRCLKNWQYFQFSHGTENPSVCSECNTAFVKSITPRSFIGWCIGNTLLTVCEILISTGELLLFVAGLLPIFALMSWLSLQHMAPVVELVGQLLVVLIYVAGATALKMSLRGLSKRMTVALYSNMAHWVIWELGDTGWTPGPEV